MDSEALCLAPVQPPWPRGCYVYMLDCGGRLYTGWTTDPAGRLRRHQSGRGAKFTHSFVPAGLAYLEQLPDKSAALRREYAVKQLTRAQKLALCALWQTQKEP